jgi:hypothetical protein
MTPPGAIVGKKYGWTELPERARPHVGTTDVDLVIGLAVGDSRQNFPGGADSVDVSTLDPAPSCLWVTTATFAFADRTTQDASSTTPCSRR